MMLQFLTTKTDNYWRRFPPKSRFLFHFSPQFFNFFEFEKKISERQLSGCLKIRTKIIALGSHPTLITCNSLSLISLSLSLSLSLSPLIFVLPSSNPLFLQRKRWVSSVTMAFAGTNQKCMACEKTVYLVDKLTADNRVYHKACFRCHHCNGTLKLSNYNSFEGVLYCRPHFDQLFKRTGSLDKSFEGTPKIVKPEKPVDSEKPTATKVASMFGGTRDKCLGCKNTVYPTEKVTVNGTAYHKSCFKCCHGGCTISPSNYIAHEGRLYCKHHHTQLIKEKGNLSQLEGDHGRVDA